MRGLRTFLGALCALAILGAFAPARSDEQITIAYHLSYKCPASKDKGPGSSPANPIPLEDFADAFDAAAAEDAEGGGSYHCRWVKLSGYFRWTDYYSYRGRLYPSVTGYYFDNGASYLIEDFADPAARRSEFQATQIEVVGQFYNLCVSAPNADMVFGPCHYEHQGMMLHGVKVLSVGKDRFRILTGEANREIADSLKPVPAGWSERRDAERSARNWLQALAAGRAALEEKLGAALNGMTPEEKNAYFAPDSWVGTLLDRSRTKLAGRDISRLPLALFYEPLDEGEAGPEIWATACACLDGSCETGWPLFITDANRLKDKFICLDLEMDVLHPERDWNWLE